MRRAIILAIIFAASTLLISATNNRNKEGFYKSHNLADENSKIKFTLGSKTFELQNYNLSYLAGGVEKNSLLTYQTTSFSVGIRASKIDQELLDWILSENQEAKTAELIVYDGDSGNVLKTISFTGVTTNSYSENFNAGNGYNINQFFNLSFRYKTIRIKLKK